MGFSGVSTSCSTSILDLVFVLDSSGSIRDANRPGFKDNWETVLDFCINLVDGLTIGMDLTRVGLVRFGNKASSIFYLNTYQTKDQIKNAISQVPYSGGNTNTSGGLREMMQNQFIEGRGDREEVINTAIVITDGVSTYDSSRTIPDAMMAQNQGIRMFSIGVTASINIDELRGLSSEPRQENKNYFTSATFEALSEISQRILTETCRVDGTGEIKEKIHTSHWIWDAHVKKI